MALVRWGGVHPVKLLKCIERLGREGLQLRQLQLTAESQRKIRQSSNHQSVKETIHQSAFTADCQWPESREDIAATLSLPELHRRSCLSLLPHQCDIVKNIYILILILPFFFLSVHPSILPFIHQSIHVINVTACLIEGH